MVETASLAVVGQSQAVVGGWSSVAIEERVVESNVLGCREGDPVFG